MLRRAEDSSAERGSAGLHPGDDDDRDAELRSLVDAAAATLTAAAEPPMAELRAQIEAVADAFLARFSRDGADRA